MGFLESIVGRRRLAGARRVGVFMLVCILTGAALMVGGSVSDTRPLLWVGVGLLVLGCLPLLRVGDLVNTLVYGLIRSRGRAAAAAVQGLAFARHDPLGIDHLGLVGVGDGVAENVAWGEIDGRPMVWFEWTRGLAGREGSFACVLIDIAADCPPLHLTRRDRNPRAGLPEVRLESGEFNRAFEVSSTDSRFATAFCDAPLMAWLIDAWPPEIQIETRGRHVLLWAPDLRRIPGVGTTLHFVMQMLGRGTGSPERVLAYARELNRRIPRMLASVWPPSAEPLAARTG